MLLPEPDDLCVLLVRTDYSDDAAWRAALDAATAAYDVGDYDRLGANLQVVEAPDLSGVTADELIALPKAGYVSTLAVADTRTMQDFTILFVDLDEGNGQVGRTFRAIPSEVEPIVANLAIANMDFFEFADAVDSDGVFRGFHESGSAS